MNEARRRRALVGSSIILALCCSWEIFSRLKNDARLFPPLEYLLFTSLPSLGIFDDLAVPGMRSAITVLANNSFVTLGRVLCGLLIGIPAGILAGLGFHFLRRSGPLSLVALTVLRSVPLLALIPLFSFWFGTSSAGILLYISFGIFTIVGSDSYEAAANVPTVLIQQAELLGASPAFLIRSVYIPGITRHLLGSIRNVVGLSWVFALGAEYISATSGLGSIAYQAYLYSDMGKLIIISSLYMALGYAGYLIVKKASSILAPWASEQFREAI